MTTRSAPPHADPAGPLPGFDFDTLHTIQATWLASVMRLMLDNRMPLSGDVTQWIRAWGEAVSQIGFFNVNIAGSGDPQLERRISGQYSYGRQLGRIIDVLAPLVDKNKALFAGDAHGKLDDFEKMITDIGKLKQPKAEDIAAEVERWRSQPDFDAKRKALIALLNKMTPLSPHDDGKAP